MSRPTMGQERQADPAGSSNGAPPQRKTIAWLLVALLIGVSGLAAWKLLSPSVTWHDDFYAASELAEKQRKPLLVFYTADWCPPCQTLKKEVLSDPDIVAYLSEHFVCVRMDLTSGMGPAAMHAAEFGVQSIQRSMPLTATANHSDSAAVPTRLVSSWNGSRA